MNTDDTPDHTPLVAPGDEYLASFAGKLEAVDIFRRLFIMCIPPRSYGEQERFTAGYRRMVVMAWVVAPEIFEGMTQVQIAAKIGLTRRGFDYLVRDVRLQLGAMRAKRPSEGSDGPPPEL